MAFDYAKDITRLLRTTTDNKTTSG